MLLTVHSQHFQLTPSTHRYVVENLQQPLERAWVKDGSQLHVSLRDLRGGDKQGIDKECRCVLALSGGPQLVITEISENMWKSIHLARKRLLRQVRQFRGRVETGSRHHRKHFLADVVNTELFVRYPRSEEVPQSRETGL
jgi:ribosome-associated translation inhibitor RaiA